MSSPQNTSPVGEEKRKGLEKYVAKFRKAIGRTPSTASNKRPSPGSASPASTTTPSSTKDATTTEATPAPKRDTKNDDHLLEIAKKAGIDPTTIDAIDLGQASERVEKKIRLRVHRTCHECQSEFGREKVCPKCSHKRCKDCTRSPPKRVKKTTAATTGTSTTGTAAAAATGAAATTSGERKSSKPLITKPGRNGGQDLVLKKPTQRVRRNCHQCDTLFTNGNKECSNCRHVRCTDCPRDPPKQKKYPYGYPHDALGEKNAFYECHECQTVFGKDESSCTKCQHSKCDKCPRTKPRAVAEQHDPEVVRSVEEKLAKMGLGGPPAVAGTA